MLVGRFSLFRILLGDFDVTLMNDANPVLCPVFFFLFVFFVFFVLLNMFLAIIMQAYITVRDQARKLGQELTLPGYIYAVFIQQSLIQCNTVPLYYIVQCIK